MKKTLLIISIILTFLLIGCGVKQNNINQEMNEVDKVSGEVIDTKLSPEKTLDVSTEFKDTLAKLVREIGDFKGAESFSYISSYDQHIWTVLEEEYIKGENPILDRALEHFSVDELSKFYEELKILEKETKNYTYPLMMGGDAHGQECEYSATSTLKVNNYDYSAENLNTIDFTTAWVEGVEGYGVGEKITIKMQERGWIDLSMIGYSGDFENGYYTEERTDLYNELTGFYIVNGYAKSDELFKANSRVKKMKLTLDDKESYFIELEDTMKPQLFKIDYKQDASNHIKPINATFEILEVYEGEKYKDTVITSIIGCTKNNMPKGG